MAAKLAQKLKHPAKGAVFGRQTVVRDGSVGPKGEARSLVQCACGSAPRLVAVTHLVRGRARYCITCAPRPGRAIQDPTAHAEVGSVWTRLTVLSHQRIDTRRMVLCACECGGQATVLLGNLISGNTRSCGCLARERKREVAARRRSPMTRLRTELARHFTPEQIAGALVRVTPDGVEVTIPARRAA